MNYILILQDNDTYEVSKIRIDMIRWCKKHSSEPTLIATVNGKESYISVPCSMIKELTPIK